MESIQNQIKLVKDRKHNIKFNDLLKDVKGSKVRVLDFKKIKETFKDFDRFIVFTCRGRFGKTDGLKDLAMNEFKENKKPSMFIKNTKVLIDNEKKKFVNTNIERINPNFQKCKVEGNNCIYENKDTVFRFVSMNGVSQEKGSRIEYNNVIFDEINEGYKFVREGFNEAYTSIISTTDNQVMGNSIRTTQWLTGNYKSINHPFLITLGITDIRDEVSIFYHKLGKIMKPAFVLLRSKFEMNEENIAELVNTDKNFLFSASLGTAGHTYFNETLENEVHNIIKGLNHPSVKLQDRTEYLIKCKQKTLGIAFFLKHHITNKPFYFVHKPNYDVSDKQHIITVDKKLVGPNVEYKAQKDALLELLSKDELFFDSQATRVVFLNELI